MANRRFIDFPIASTSGDTDIILIWQDGANKQTTKATFLGGLPENLEDLNDVVISGLTNGQILRYNSTTGVWENTDQGNLDLNDLNDVTIVSPSNGQVLVYNSSTSKWENSSGGYVPYTGAVTTVNLGSQQLIAGQTTITTNGSTDTLTVNHTSGSGKAINVTKGGNGEGLYIDKTSGSGNAATIVGTLEATTLVKTGGTSSQFLKADGSVDLTTYVPSTRNITINGTTQDLSADRTYNVGTVTSVGLSSATSGVTIGSSPVTTSGTITLAIATASGSQNGLLSSTDWTTFNGKQNALTNPVTGTGTTNYLPKFTGASTIGNSQVFDNGTNVGIGTVSPQTVSSGFTLTVGDGATQQQPYLALSRNSLGGFWAGIRWYDGNTIKSVIQEDSDFNLRFSTSNAERLRITSGGNLLVGTTTDNGARLQVSGAATFSSSVTAANTGFGETGGFIINYRDNAASRSWRLGNDLDAFGDFGIQQSTTQTGSTYSNRLYITSSGNVGIGMDSPIYVLDAYSTGSSTARLRVQGTTNFALTQAQNSSGILYMGIDSSTANGFGLGNYSRIIWSSAAYPLIFAVNDTERMRITSGGNVGIGNTPSDAYTGYKLQVGSSSDSQTFISIGNSSSGLGPLNGLVIGNDSTGADIYQRENLPLRLHTNNTERMRITSNGNVLIGTTTDGGAKLQVSGDSGYSKGIVIKNSSSSSNNLSVLTLQANADGFSIVEFKEGATQKWQIYNDWNNDSLNLYKWVGTPGVVLSLSSTGAATFSGSVTATSFITSSDLRLKEVIEKDGDLAIYKRKGEEQIHYGYIAQEMQESYPNQVHEAQDGYLSLNYVEILVKKVNELEKKIKQLEK